jgi:hypothetical protein
MLSSIKRQIHLLKHKSPALTIMIKDTCIQCSSSIVLDKNNILQRIGGLIKYGFPDRVYICTARPIAFTFHIFFGTASQIHNSICVLILILNLKRLQK